MRAYWFKGSGGNIGDVVTPYIARRTSGDAPTHATTSEPGDPLVLGAGSILGDRHISLNGSIVWGSGCIEADDKLAAGVPQEIRSVRGPLTRAILRASGLDCPERYGDPALILPFCYCPQFVVPDGRVGIVPHYTDAGAGWLGAIENDDRFFVISPRLPVEVFIAALMRCKAVVSSSLHGLIIADAYCVPSAWIRIGDGVRGDGFKFRDYYGGLGLIAPGPVEVAPDATLNDATPELLQAANDASVSEIDPKIFAGLIESNPFAPHNED